MGGESEVPSLVQPAVRDGFLVRFLAQLQVQPGVHGASLGPLLALGAVQLAARDAHLAQAKVQFQAPAWKDGGSQAIPCFQFLVRESLDGEFQGPH